MERRQELTTKLHALEKRLNHLEVGFGELTEISLTLEAVLELFIGRRLLPRRQPSPYLNRALQSYRERIGEYAMSEIQKLLNSLSDEEMESLDEGEMPHA